MKPEAIIASPHIQVNQVQPGDIIGQEMSPDLDKKIKCLLQQK